MGEDKAMMRFEGKPLVLRAAELLQPMVNTVSLLGPRERYGNLGYPVIPDPWLGVGPLAGLCAGLVSSDTEWNLFLACDLPRITRTCLALVIDKVRVTRSMAVVPQGPAGWQPLCAAYHIRCRPLFERAIEHGKFSVVGLFEQLHPDTISGDELAALELGDELFANVNTREDWDRLIPEPPSLQ